MHIPTSTFSKHMHSAQVVVEQAHVSFAASRGNALWLSAKDACMAQRQPCTCSSGWLWKTHAQLSCSCTSTLHSQPKMTFLAGWEGHSYNRRKLWEEVGGHTHSHHHICAHGTKHVCYIDGMPQQVPQSKQHMLHVMELEGVQIVCTRVSEF